jgi:hypothetical protein
LQLPEAILLLSANTLKALKKATYLQNGVVPLLVVAFWQKKWKSTFSVSL